MKYLSEIIEDRQNKLFRKYDIFFAFSEEQLERGLKKTGRKKEEITSAIGMGLICPKEYVQAFLDEHETVVIEGIAEDIAQAGIEAVVRRELSNHEAYYTGDIESTVDALEAYPVNRDDIKAIFKNKNHQITGELTTN